MNIIAWLEFELAYYDVAVQYVSRSTTEIPLRNSTNILNDKHETW